MAGVEMTEMELKEVDICDADVCFGGEEEEEEEEESGVFLSSGASCTDGFSAFHKWVSKGHDADPQSPNGTQKSFPRKRSRVTNGSHGVCVEEAGCRDPGERRCGGDEDEEEENDDDDDGGAHAASIVDGLLEELYDSYGGHSRGGADSLDSSTEASSSDAFLGRSSTGSNFLQELQEKHTRRHQMNYLAQKDPMELKCIIDEVKYRIGIQSAKLVRQLKRKDRLHHKQQKKCDIVTACLQAVSQKRRVDTRLKFTLEPSLGKNGFQQWYDALKAVARLPTGIPKEWRRRVWLTLADQYLHSISIDWEKTMRFAFNERSNPDDDSLGIQIVKDLHRTGCSSYCGQEAEQDRVVLKRVLLAYARWNKTVGYCQGFNVLAALILEVTEGNEGDALKVMIYLIDKVLPDSYFANNLRALSVDMAVFRDLLRLKLPELSQHLHHLQKVANRTGGGSYEPPLTNVFTMQWFLTMFATCLPHHTVLKIWDSVFFEGSEVLLRVALAIWAKLAERIEDCQTADEFYSTMGVLTQEMQEHNLVDSNELMQTVYSMAAFPFPHLAELREKYTYNITPFPAPVKANGSQGLHGWESDDDGDMDDEDSIVTALGCLGPLGGLLAPEIQRYQKHLKEQRGEQSTPCSDMAVLSPGAVGAARTEHQATMNSMMLERMSTDISALTKQYSRIKRRQQQQARLFYIRTGLPVEAESVSPRQPSRKESLDDTDKCPATSVLASQVHTSPVVNHLLLGRKPRAPQRPTKNGVVQGTGGHFDPMPHAHSTPNQDHGARARLQSPWRTHMRTHRRNLARARAQLGFDDCDKVEDDTSPEPKPEVAEEEKITNKEVQEEVGGEVEEEEEEEEENRKVDNEDLKKVDQSVQVTAGERDSELGLQDASCDTEREIQEMEQQLSGLDLGPPAPAPSPAATDPESSSQTSDQPELQKQPPLDSKLHLAASAAPCPTRRSESSSSESGGSSLRQSPSLTSSTPGTPHKPQQIFSPFPCVKAPRKSAAARNLGLYGPTSRTPTVHFPHMSKDLNRLGASASLSTRRR